MNHRDIKLVATNERWLKRVSRPNYDTLKRFPENLLAIKLRKTEVKTHSPLYFGLSILDIRKIAIHINWYNYIKRMYEDTANLLQRYR